MKKTLLSVILVIALLLSQFTVFAAFSDMKEDRLSWAKTAVEEMAEAGLIKGYEDGTFRPDNAVTKQEALVLISRIVGFTDKSSAAYSDVASELFAETLEKYATPYKAEISYLLYKGILKADDLAVYVADTEAEQPLKRYEAAVLLTKIFENDLSAVEKAELKISFSDLSDIPAAAKPYVNYVVDKGLMNGMGDNLFMPNEKLTRAMIATLLYRINSGLELTFTEGEFLRYSSSNSSLRISTADEETVTVSVKAGVPVILDGSKASLADFPAGTKVRITKSGKDVIFVEGLSSSFETTVSGIYSSFEKFEDSTKINLKNPKSGEIESYVISPSVTVTKNDKASSVSDLVKSDFVTASIKAGKVIHILAEDKTITVSGEIDSIVFEPEFAIKVAVSGEIVSYSAGDNVTVKRNGKSTDLSALVAGDSVKLTLEYGLISEISATSSSFNETGTIGEIVISNTPSLTLTIDGEKETYYLSRDAVISAADDGNTVYDLRLGDTVDVTIEGKTITKVSTVSSIASNTNFNGIIENVESSYGYIKLVDSASLVFTKGAKIQDSNGTSLTIRNLSEGDSVTIFGTSTSGAVEATLIVVNK